SESRASAALADSSPSSHTPIRRPDVDARDKPGHDELGKERAGHSASQTATGVRNIDAAETFGNRVEIQPDSRVALMAMTSHLRSYSQPIAEVVGRLALIGCCRRSMSGSGNGASGGKAQMHAGEMECPFMAPLGSAARGEWRPLSDPKRKSVNCWRWLVYEFT